VVGFGKVRCGEVRYGMVWWGEVWYGLGVLLFSKKGNHNQDKNVTPFKLIERFK